MLRPENLGTCIEDRSTVRVWLAVKSSRVVISVAVASFPWHARGLVTTMLLSWFLSHWLSRLEGSNLASSCPAAHVATSSSSRVSLIP